ncbi:hypothetical protein [Microbulbifer sp. 2205BS26-8]|uniref:hypothetical protein n=1 Tax=Microbulbifer sp. 2205BS26-8 TaxID=3064386 RepID=UPI00274021E9|nr:hypothetical protein [Microbulbifer sp. 2205BS26-8]MDP5209301.1 hypothetical protein [Microbulbifer sp. 2205BS26-8]
MNRGINWTIGLAGGTVGWLTTEVFAAEHYGADACGMQVGLMESADIPGKNPTVWATVGLTSVSTLISDARVVFNFSRFVENRWGTMVVA